MPGPVVQLVADQREWQLSDEPLTAPACPVVLKVSDFRSRNVVLDGRRVRLTPGQVGLVPIDLTRSTGFHRLQIDGFTFWFGTEDAKLGLAGVVEMLDHLKTLGTGWTGQALFSDGTGLRDVHVLYAWLDQWADQALDAVASVLATPRSVTFNARALSRRGGRAVLLAPTLQLLRSDPRRHLSPNPVGMLEVDGSRYDPRRVVVRKRTNTLITIANARAVHLLEWLARLCREVIAEEPDQNTAVRCRLWSNQVKTLQHRPLAQALTAAAASTPPTAPRQREEVTESRYRVTYAISKDVLRLFGWSASVKPLPRYSYVERADTIYQAYCASRIAQALGMTATSPVLGSKPIAFGNDRFDLYYDTPPPAGVLRSWRATSSRPDASRPDLLLHERETGRVALLDAKYRLERVSGGASEDSRKEVTSYLGLYGLRSIGILYPGVGEHSIVRGHGRQLLEIPLSPRGSVDNALEDLLDSLELPPFQLEQGQ